MRTPLRAVLLIAATLLASGCEGFRSVGPDPAATGPIPAGFARLRIENRLSQPVLETWYSPCVGGDAPKKVTRTIPVGESTDEDVLPGCTRITLYPRNGAKFLSTTAVEGVVTTVTARE